METFLGVLGSLIYMIIGALAMYLYLYVREITKENSRLRRKLKNMKNEPDEPEVIRVIDITDY